MKAVVRLAEIPEAVPAAAAAYGVRAFKAERTRAGKDMPEDGVRAIFAMIERFAHVDEDRPPDLSGSGNKTPG